VLRIIFGPKRVTEEWRRLHKEELYAVYSLPNIIRIMKSRILKWAGHVACIGKRKVHTGFWWGNLNEGDHLEGTGINGTIILKWMFEWWMGACTGSMWLRTGTGNELL
jgi:hypothetical protein